MAASCTHRQFSKPLDRRGPVEGCLMAMRSHTKTVHPVYACTNSPKMIYDHSSCSLIVKVPLICNLHRLDIHPFYASYIHEKFILNTESETYVYHMHCYS